MAVSLQEIRHVIQDYSLPLLFGILVAVVFANASDEDYNYAFGKKGSWEPGHMAIFGHHVTINFLVNDIFMCFFFGLAAKEVVEAFLPGGSLDPPSKAINPVAACVGGVVGPVAVFFVLVTLFDALDAFEGKPFSTTVKGWGIPTATDIALAWMVASQVFKSTVPGKVHPAINYLLLMAVIDDAIGLIIIAVYYTDPDHPPEPIWLLLCVGGMLISFGLRKLKVKWWPVYVLLGGVPCWCGLLKASVHPALALIPVIPFMPDQLSDPSAATVAPLTDQSAAAVAPSSTNTEKHEADDQSSSSPVVGFDQFDQKKLVLSEDKCGDVGMDKGLGDTSVDKGLGPTPDMSSSGAGAGSGSAVQVGFDADGRSFRDAAVAPIHVAHELHEIDAPLHQFEDHCKLGVDIGLFFFSLCNAGVQFSEVGAMTATVLLSLVLGKTLGVVGFAMAAEATGRAPVPEGISTRDLWFVGFIASLGLTVALFVAGEAFEDKSLQSQAKMGALLSGLVGFAAIGLARLLESKEGPDAKYVDKTAADGLEEGAIPARAGRTSRPQTSRPGGRKHSLNETIDHRLAVQDIS